MSRKRKAIIYTKICLPCAYKDGWTLVQSWATVNEVDLQVRRTTYNPIYHKLAAKAYGNEKYLAFMKIGGKKIKIKKLIELIKENGDDLRRLLASQRRDRKNRVAVAKEKAVEKAEDEA